MSSSPESRDPIVVTAMDMPQLLVRPAIGDTHEPAAGARAAGFAAGYAEGLRQATQQAALAAGELRERERLAAADRLAATTRATQALERAAARLGDLSDGLMATLTDVVIDEVVTLAEGVIGAELSDPGLRAAAALRRAMSGVGDRAAAGHRVSIRLHPADVAALDLGAAAGGVEIVADPGLEPGDATAVSGDRWVDARLRQTLHRVREAIGS